MKLIIAFIIFYLGISSGFDWALYPDKHDKTENIIVVNERAAGANIYDWLMSIQNFGDDISLQVNTTIPRVATAAGKSNTPSVDVIAARLGFVKLIEYTATSGSAGFHPGVDQVVQSYYLRNQTWTPLTIVRQTIGGGTIVNTLCTSTPDGLVSLCFFFAAQRLTPFSTNGTSVVLAPNAMFMTLTVGAFPYISGTSKLALKVAVDATPARGLLDVHTVAITESSPEEDGFDLSADPPGNRPPINNRRPTWVWKKSFAVTGAGCSPTGTVQGSGVFTSDPPADLDPPFNGEDTMGIDLPLVRSFTYLTFERDCTESAQFIVQMQFGTSGVAALAPSIFLLIVICLIFVE